MRKPVRSAVANRKYFQGGGLAPMKPAAPEEAVGIMASSQPLVDMVAQSAGNPQGGMSPLNFNQGGSVFLRQANQVPTESSILNFNQRDLKKRLVPTLDIPKRKPGFSIDVPETGSRLEKILKTKINLPSLLPGALSGVPSQILGTKVNLPLRSPFKGIAQYFGSDPADEGGIASRFPTASSSQLATLDALAQMNPNNKDEIYSLGEKIITDDKSEATGEDLANLMKSEKLMLDKKADDELDRIQKEANEQARKEAEGKAPEIDPITKEDSQKTITKLTNEAEKEKTIENIVSDKKGDTTSQESQGQVDQEGQVDQDQQDTEVETAIDTTTKAVQENINAIKEAANTNDKKTVENNLEEYIEEFKAAMPKYEGMTEEEKGFAIIEAGLNIAAGESTNAIMNIANGLKPVVAKLAKNKEAEKAFNTQINISAAKYGIERLNNDRDRNFNLEDEMRKYMREEKTFFVSNPKGETIDGVFYKQGSPITLTNQQINDGAFEKIKGKVTSEGIMKQLLTNEAAYFKAVADRNAEELKAGRITTKDADKLIKFGKDGEELVKNAETNVKMLAMLDVGMKFNAEKKITGFNNYALGKLDSLLNATGFKGEIKELDRLAKFGQDKKQFLDQQQVIANMMIKEILGEGSKNVSNIDRQLAGEIVGLLRDREAIFANPELLHQRLQRIRGRISSSLKTNISSMKSLDNRLLEIEYGKGKTTVEDLQELRKKQFQFDDPRRQAIIDKALQEQFGEADDVAQQALTNVLNAEDYFNFDTGAVKKKI